MRAAASLMIGSLLLGGCGLAPEPIPIYEDARVLVRLLYDPQAGTGHSHPATLTSEQIAAALQGARIQNRDALGLGGLFREAGSAPAFSAGEIAVLARHLAAALRKASPKDLATFYLATMDPALGRLVTSGGLFVRQGKLYLILANARTSPTSGTSRSCPSCRSSSWPDSTRRRPGFPTGRSGAVTGTAATSMSRNCL
jgi:hypothetical protein